MRTLHALNLRTLASRAGRWSATHRRAAIGGWLAFVIAALAIGNAVGTQTLSAWEKNSGETDRAARVLHGAGFSDEAHEAILVTGAGRAAAVADLQARLRALPQVAELRPARPSGDGTATLVQVQLAASLDDAPDAVGPVEDAAAAVAATHPRAALAQAGDGTLLAAGDEATKQDFRKAELFSIPLTFAILLVAFGSVVAAGIPLLLGLSSVAAAIGLIALPSRLMPLEESAASVILLIGLAVGVDYALFYLRREREERAAGRTTDAALAAASATSGRAVLVSGFTVIASVAGMFVAGNAWYSSYALGIITVVAIAMIGSLTVLPAVLSWLGDRVDKGRMPWARRRVGAGDGSGRVWSAIVDAVLRRPLVSALAALALLGALAVPATQLSLGDHGIRALPQDEPVVAAYEQVQAHFPGGDSPAIVAVQAADVRAPAVQAGLDALARRAAVTDGLGPVLSTDVSADGRVARVLVPLAGDGVDERSIAALHMLRDTVLPETIAAVPGVRAEVAGATAASADFTAVNNARTPWVFAAVLGLAFLILLVTFRSIVVPIKAILLNLLSVAAAYGVLVLVFQHGWGHQLLGFEPSGRVSSWLPVLLFAILFGLSMDYHVIVLSRIREAFDRGASMDDAVRIGIRATAGTVTSAAVVMVAVFSIFTVLSLLDMKQVGVGLAAAILIDATIVRAVLLPATMKLLGRWNWWLPGSPLPRPGACGYAPAPAPAGD